MAYTINNSAVDTLAAAVAAPYGPLTRVTNVSTLPTPNSDIKLEFTSALSATVYLTYEELQTPGSLLYLLEIQHGLTTVVETIKADVAELYAYTNGLSAPHTEAEYQQIQEYIRGYRWLQNIVG